MTEANSVQIINVLFYVPIVYVKCIVLRIFWWIHTVCFLVYGVAVQNMLACDFYVIYKAMSCTKHEY